MKKSLELEGRGASYVGVKLPVTIAALETGVLKSIAGYNLVT